jgi:hypothetical protein
MTIELWDETLPGKRASAGSLTLATKSLTVRELLRVRIQKEVAQYNQTLPETFEGLVQPEAAERLLNGFRLGTRRPLDWEAQFRQACSSFNANGFLVLVGDQQITDLDLPFYPTPDSKVSFVKLLPLVGG